MARRPKKLKPEPAPPPDYRVRITVDLSVEMHTQFKLACVRNGTGISDEIRRMIKAEYGAGNPAGAKMGKPAARAT